MTNHVSSPTLALAALALIHPLTAQTAVSPADRTDLEGSSTTAYPLGRHNCRYQQLYGDVPARTIQGHAYRRDALGSRGSIPGYKVDLAVTLSAVAHVPGKIRRAFADNLGPSATEVVSRAVMSFPTTSRPTQAPGSFAIRLPYSRPYAWSGQGSLCLDITIYGNETPSGTDRNFAADFDAQQLYATRNVQPGYRFGQGCPARGQTAPAWCAFELRHEGTRMDLQIDSRNGVPSTASQPAQSALLLALDSKPNPWPPGSGCTVFGTTSIVLPLAGDNDSRGNWRGVLDVGAPAPAMFAMTAQIVSHSAASADLTLSDASRLIAPPTGQGIVSARVTSASDRTATTGSTSTSIPVTMFF